MKTKKPFLIIIVILFSFQLHSQKNAVYGTFGQLYNSISVERALGNSTYKKCKLNISAGLGILDNSLVKPKMANVSLHLLVGKRKHFFEFKMGYGKYWDFVDHEYSRNGLWQIASLGYRLEMKYGLIRMGIGVPEFLYFGGGLRF